MKPTFPLRTFILRALLVGSTLVALALAYAAETWRQDRLLNEVLKETDYNTLCNVGYTDGRVSLGLIGGEGLTESTARRIVQTKRISWVGLTHQPSPEVRRILSTGFVEVQDKWKGPGGYWYRKGGDRQSTNAETWQVIEGAKRYVGDKGYFGP